MAAIQAVVNEGGKVGFVAALVDRQEGGRDKIEAMGYPVVALFNREEVLGKNAGSRRPTDCAVA
jgi:orotate phosphoribosyltransferase